MFPQNNFPPIQSNYIISSPLTSKKMESHYISLPVYGQYPGH